MDAVEEVHIRKAVVQRLAERNGLEDDEADDPGDQVEQALPCLLYTSLDEAVENRLGMDPQKHKEYLYHFYEGNFPGSWAKGELYNYDPATGDARSCGTTASLCGIEQALEKNDKIALDYAVKRDLLLHTAMAFLQGFPMLNCGDEIAQLNGWDYKNDPDRVEDSRLSLIHI